MAAVAGGHVRPDAKPRLAARRSGDDVVDEGDVRSLRRHVENRRCAFSAGPYDDVDGVVVDHDWRDDEAGAAVTLAFGIEARVDDNASLDAFDAARFNRSGQLAHDGQRIAFETVAVGTAVAVIDILERERLASMNAAREIGIAARDQHEVASKGAVRRYVPGFVCSRAKPMVGPEQLQR